MTDKGETEADRQSARKLPFGDVFCWSGGGRSSNGMLCPQGGNIMGSHRAAGCKTSPPADRVNSKRGFVSRFLFRSARLFIIQILILYVRNSGSVFAILFEVLFIEIQEEIRSLCWLGGGVDGAAKS